MVNVVYMIVRSVQFLIFLASFGLVYHIYNEKNTAKQRVLLLASICAVLNMYGYLEALSTLSEQSSKWAVRSQYVTALLFMVSMLHLMAMFCEFHIRKWQTIVLWVISMVFVMLLFIDESINMLFRNYKFSIEFLAVQIRFELLTLGYIYMAYMAFLFVAVLYVGIVVRWNQQREGVITVVACSAVLPSVAFVLNAAGLTGGFDFGPTLMALSCWLVVHFNKSYHLLDDGEIARETILDELGEGYIILDSERNVKSYNYIAAMLYPELEQVGEREVIIELIYLHNHDILEHNGKICNVVVSELKENGDLTGYVVWLYDCTDEYNYMKDLEQIQEKVTVSDRTRDLFLHHMTNGFGSPLYIIKNRADVIYHDERASEDEREMSLEILEAGQKLEDMVSVMKEYSYDQYSYTAQEKEYLTADLVQQLRAMIEERRQGRCQKIQLTVSSQLPKNWYGDFEGIQRVLRGILQCAGISSRLSGIELNVTSEMRYADALLILTLSLDDNGTTTAELNRLARIVQKAGKKADVEVNYIPYSLCKRLLLEMKGSMECSVDVNRSKISLMFPQKVVDNTPFEWEDEIEVQATSVDPKEASKDGEKHSRKRATVLVVDDNLLYLKEMDAWLRKMHVKTIMARSGAECLRILERKHVDLVFMDQMMPGMDGTQTLLEIRRMEAERGEQTPVPVVVLTMDDSIGASKRYLEFGFDGYLAKPIESHQIREQVERHLKPVE